MEAIGDAIPPLAHDRGARHLPACTKPGTSKSPCANAFAIDCRWVRISATPAESVESRWSSIRPPSGRSSNWWAEVYWSTPMADSPRVCMLA
jgi:hypothetical protein